MVASCRGRGTRGDTALGRAAAVSHEVGAGASTQHYHYTLALVARTNHWLITGHPGTGPAAGACCTGRGGDAPTLLRASTVLPLPHALRGYPEHCAVGGGGGHRYARLAHPLMVAPPSLGGKMQRTRLPPRH